MTDKERRDLIAGYQAAIAELESQADEPVKKARQEQDDRITGKDKAKKVDEKNAAKAGVILPENNPNEDLKAEGKYKKDSADIDPIETARAEQLTRITNNR